MWFVLFCSAVRMCVVTLFSFFISKVFLPVKLSKVKPWGKSHVSSLFWFLPEVTIFNCLKTYVIIFIYRLWLPHELEYFLIGNSFTHSLEVLSVLPPADGPASVAITGADIVTVGILYGFECSAYCYPACQYTWSRGNVTSHGPELSLQLLQWVPTQTLTCTVVNPASNQSVTVQKTLQVTGMNDQSEVKFTSSFSCTPFNQIYSQTFQLGHQTYRSQAHPVWPAVLLPSLPAQLTATPPAATHGLLSWKERCSILRKETQFLSLHLLVRSPRKLSSVKLRTPSHISTFLRLFWCMWQVRERT